MQLIERFYDPDQGLIKFDDIDVKEYNLAQLRKTVGYVGQEPVLFAMSIKKNLLLGKSDATDQEMEEALKKVNAWEFVNDLEKKMDTYVGVSGGQLSGGQKQRIAIARAILLNPKILLLDESTSALDRKNEREIQQALDEFSKDRTTVTIAHRLQTIKNSDIIFVLDSGKVVEQGSHTELMNIGSNGFYYKLVQNQFGGDHEEQNEEEEEEEENNDKNSDNIESPSRYPTKT